MPPKFGTSGLRGLVTELTPDLVADHIRAFIRACDPQGALYVGHDLRASSPALAAVVRDTGVEMGLQVHECGAVPTPALAQAAWTRGAAVMVTGSHIPADRNGLKFYTPDGEITKEDEAAILNHLGAAPGTGGGGVVVHDAATPYAARLRGAYGRALQGLTLGFYAQSAVGRDLMQDLLRDLGATVTELGRSDAFIPVDTEAVSDAMRAQLQDWATTHRFDAILSTDADGDRPLLTDHRGTIIPGDVLGQITGAALGAAVAVTPVSSNTGAETVFPRVIRTRIGSPHVIAGMAGQGDVVGYEASGGFLLGFDATGPAGPLPALPTRDGALPLIATLAEAARAGSVAAVLQGQPRRATAADRLENIPETQSAALIAGLGMDRLRAGFLAELGLTEARIDQTDGLRITARSGDVVHLRPSGNAPELRLYVETGGRDTAAALLEAGLTAIRARL